jgi:hypothetical protein
MAGEQGRYGGIDPGKRTRETAIITRTGKFKVTAQGDQEPEEKTVFFKGTAAAEDPGSYRREKESRDRGINRLHGNTPAGGTGLL